MRILIYGAGTIGLTYAWLLSSRHTIAIFVKPEAKPLYENGIPLVLKDRRESSDDYREHLFQPKMVTDLTENYDLILVTVGSSHLQEATQQLATCPTSTTIVIMQNNWDIQNKLSALRDRENLVLAFPSSVGGGRKKQMVQAIIFKEPTLIDACPLATQVQEVFESCHIATKRTNRLADWMKVHCLQQAVMAGPIAQAGSFEHFLTQPALIQKMILAWREGLLLCEKHNISRKAYKPSQYLFLPLFLLTPVLKRMLSQPLVQEMITRHLQSGYQEWADQYKEILEDGNKNDVAMPVWQSYQPFIQTYLKTIQKTD